MSDNAEPVSDPVPDNQDAADPLSDDAPPAANPTQDPDATEDQEHAIENPLEPDSNGDDAESDLSEIDEATFDDLDTDALYIDTAVNADDAPVDINSSNVGLLGTHKRKRAEGEDGGAKKKKKKRKELTRRQEAADSAARNGRPAKQSRSRVDPESEATAAANLENMSEKDRELLALEKRMNEALRRPTTRRPKGSRGDMDTAHDEMLDNMAHRMNIAVQSDATDHKAGNPALAKLTLLPEAMELLNRQTLQGNIIDADSRILESVRFFLEPLEPDGALPAHDIQREMITLLGRLPLDKDTLISSGLGKVIMFYTRSKKPETKVKRAAERLLGEWTRPLLKRSSLRSRPDFRNEAPPSPNRTPLTLQESQAAAARERILAKPETSHRAMVDRQLPNYSLAPRSTANAPAQARHGMDGFSRLKARHQLANRFK